VTIRISVSGTGEIRRLARGFRSAAGGGLQRDLTSELTREGKPVLRQVQSAVRGIEVGSERGGGTASTNLRGRLAAATTVEPQGAGVLFEVHGSRVGEAGHRLAKLSDTTLAPRWRHPVFGNRRVWKTNVGQPWFFVTIRAAEGQFRAAVLRAMQRTARKIMG
jgi:hypothetical protein